MILECGYHGHILALYVKTYNDLILVGDILRSICVLRFKERDSLVEEVARDFNSNLMRSVEIWNENYFIGAEDHGNIFIMKNPTNPKSDEERNRLEVQSGYHLGDFVNAITKGSLSRTTTISQINDVDDNNNNETKNQNQLQDQNEEVNGKSKIHIVESLLLGTVSGRLSTLFPISKKDFIFLTILEKCLIQVVKNLSVGGLSHEDWRGFYHERRSRNQGYRRNTIDGDLIEKFLDLNDSVMEQVTKYVNDELLHLSKPDNDNLKESDKISADKVNNQSENLKENFIPLTVNDIVQRVEDLSRMH